MARAAPRSHRLRAVLVAALVVGGCASPFGKDEPETSDEPRDDLAATADEEVIEPPDAPEEARATDGSAETTTTARVGAGPGGTRSTTGAGAASPARVVLNLRDSAGDADTLLDDSPAYADALQVTIEDVGDDARVTVRVATSLPRTLDDGEVIGIGIDFYRSSKAESDYQLFADGGVDGWRAFLQTPKGFVDFPGTFGVAGGLVQFRVPWSALGGDPTGSVFAFLDWSAKGDLVGESTTDNVPNRGTAPFG